MNNFYGIQLKKRLLRTDFERKRRLKGWKATSILHKTIFTVAQAEQFTATEKEENLVVPDEFPQDAANAHLFLGCEFHVGDGGVFIMLLHLVLLESQLHELIAKVDESDARSVVAAIHDHHDSVSQFLVVVEEMHWICVEIHSCFVLVDDANIVIFS